MKFIGRQRELEALETEYRKEGGFAVLYGRRRVGKTTLIKEFIKDKPAFYFLATEEVETQSMKRLAGVVARVTQNPMLQRVAFSDWLDLFRLIAEYRPEQKKVLVIDEFPYLVKSNQAFPSILQNAWDEILKDSNVMLILCGSLIGMMQKHALSYDSPLYGRRTAQIRLAPLPFTDVYAAQGLAFEKAVEQYAITGGVPKYLEFFNEQDDLLKQVESVVLSKNGFLYEEPNFLLKDEVMSAVNYFSIIRVMAEGSHKLGKIAGAMGIETSGLTPYLSTLSDLGFIVKETPVTEKNPEKSRKGLYFISDNFVRFWFRYVYPYKGELELDNTQLVLDEIRKDFTQKFVAFAYEDICRAIFAKLCRDQSIPFTPSRIGSYWLNDLDSDTEIDVMAVDRQNRQVFAGECKFHVKPVDAAVFFTLRDKVQASSEIQSAFRGYRFLYGIFSKSGFTPRLLDLAGQNPDLYLINEDKLNQGNS
ncbi:ATP-binding protein [Intestinimonas butyriciproducens]|uniref:Archaeal ATPase, fused to C-terminal DUF234 domain n=1 Tax=Intestinimonas butyriciproducens TaxID=1297617 RepID=A0A0S2VZQ4_9FIRM|nr:ATP-binding protein [Intestinimonas butyriciproducens]ALP92466.1 archaeal ATPase, fused to C-terminal DUF234 domain [Intestinimonas butyriciproducens]